MLILVYTPAISKCSVVVVCARQQKSEIKYCLSKMYKESLPEVGEDLRTRLTFDSGKGLAQTEGFGLPFS